VIARLPTGRSSADAPALAGQRSSPQHLRDTCSGRTASAPSGRVPTTATAGESGRKPAPGVERLLIVVSVAERTLPHRVARPGMRACERTTGRRRPPPRNRAAQYRRPLGGAMVVLTQQPAPPSSPARRLGRLADYMGYCPHRRKTRVTGRPVICARCRRNARRKSRVARSSVMGHALASPPPPSRQRHGRRPARPQGAPLVDVSQGRHPLGRLRTHSTDHDSTRRGPSFLAFTRRRHPVATA
jgi:hypothetical protein